MRPFATATDAPFTRVRLRLKSTKKRVHISIVGKIYLGQPRALGRCRLHADAGIEFDRVVSRFRNFIFMAKGRLDRSAAYEWKLFQLTLHYHHRRVAERAAARTADVREAKAANTGISYL